MARNKNVSNLPRNKNVVNSPTNWTARLAKLRWNRVIYKQITGIENGKESTSLQKPLRLGKRRSFRRGLRSFRVRVSRLRIRVKISPVVWLKKLADAYVQMMLVAQDQLGSGAGLVMGFQTVYPGAPPFRPRRC